MQQLEQAEDSSQGNRIVDSVLAKQALSGEQWAFEMLVHRYQPQLTQLICHILNTPRNDDRVTTILQETWLRLYRFLPTLVTHSILQAWLVHVTRNLCITELRSLRRHPHLSFSELAKTDENEDDGFLETMLVDPYPLPEEIVELHELRATIQRVFEQLPSQYQIILFLHYTRQMSLDEIGQQLKIPKKTVQNALYRGRVRLRETLFAEGVLP